MTSPKSMTFAGLLLAATFLSVPARAQDGVVISVQVAPPLLPVYAQPPMPDTGYIWTPGYWAWAASSGYYWVPGTWILPPSEGVLWTPPYWGWDNGLYIFHAGYWGEHVGYYGGVNYGYGYGGVGYQGGRWDRGHFAYNQAVNNFGSVQIHNSYRQNVTVYNWSHTSFAGGSGGVRGAPRASERQAERETHLPMTREQAGHFSAAASHPGLVASHNNARPEIAATSHPAQFQGAGVIQPRPQRPAPAQYTPGRGQPAQNGAAPYMPPGRDHQGDRGPAQQAPIHEQPVRNEPVREQPVREQRGQHEPARQMPPREQPVQHAPPVQPAAARLQPAQQAAPREAPARQQPPQQAAPREAPARQQPAQHTPPREEKPGER